MAPPIPLDRNTGAAIIVTHEEHDIHQGNSFTFHFQSAAPLPTAIGEETAVGFTTPTTAESGKLIHMTVSALADDESTFEIREAPTVVVDQGDELDALNRFRPSVNISELRTHQTAPPRGALTTYNVAKANSANLEVGTGTVLHSETLAIGGAAPFASAENILARGQKEWILKPGTDYVIILTNLTINDTVHHITLNWSESEIAHYVS